MIIWPCSQTYFSGITRLSRTQEVHDREVWVSRQSAQSSHMFQQTGLARIHLLWSTQEQDHNRHWRSLRFWWSRLEWLKWNTVEYQTKVCYSILDLIFNIGLDSVFCWLSFLIMNKCLLCALFINGSMCSCAVSRCWIENVWNEHFHQISLMLELY